MREVNATDMKNQFGEFLDLTRDEAIGIRKLMVEIVLIGFEQSDLLHIDSGAIERGHTNSTRAIGALSPGRLPIFKIRR